MISDADRRLLLQIARAAITAHVTGMPLAIDEPVGEAARLAGAFVSLHKAGALRGCIGHIEAHEPLARVVARCAVAAGTTDPRFQAVTAPELALLDIELSILGPLEPVANLDEVEVGRHGLVVEMGQCRGLLLPQVAAALRWDREALVVQTCRKAGLRVDAWKNGATLWKFEAEVFGEHDYV